MVRCKENETMNPEQEQTAEAEHRFHNYVGSRIPWYVRFIWIGFWIFAVYYTVTYLFPSLQQELKYLL
jgi:hypothetical protein